MPIGDNPLYPHMQPLFSRTGDFEDGHINSLFGTGGCLIDQSQCSLPSPAFDPALNEVGGEDDAMFGWTTQAIAVEHIPPHRSTPAYVWTRNFAFGQGPSQNEADKGFSGALGVIKWMRLSQAIGKIFWFEGFSPRLYGANAPTAHKEA